MLDNNNLFYGVYRSMVPNRMDIVLNLLYIYGSLHNLN